MSNKHPNNRKEKAIRHITPKREHGWARYQFKKMIQARKAKKYPLQEGWDS